MNDRMTRRRTRRAATLTALGAAGAVFATTLIAAPGATPRANAASINPGDLIVVDANASWNPRYPDGEVIKVDPSGNQVVVAPLPATASSELRDPTGLTVDAAGNFLVADPTAFNNNGGVVSIDPRTGAQSPVTSERSFINPTGVAVDPTSRNGDLLVVDADALGGLGAVIRVQRSTNEQVVVSSGQYFGNPAGIAVATDGTIYIADPDAANGAGGVIKIPPRSSVQSLLSSGRNFGNPKGIALDTNGNIYVADPDARNGAGGVIKVDPTGTQSVVSSGRMFGNPTGIAVDATGTNIYVADPDALGGNGAIFKVDTGGGQTVISRGQNFRDPVGIIIGSPTPPAPVQLIAPYGPTTFNVSASACSKDAQPYTVPAGVSALRFDVTGAGGRPGTTSLGFAAATAAAAAASQPGSRAGWP